MLRSHQPSPDAYDSNLVIKPVQVILCLLDSTMEVIPQEGEKSLRFDRSEIKEVQGDDLNGHTIAGQTYYGFRLVVGEAELDLATMIAEDRHCWLRVLRLIIKMNSLGISDQINAFVFEHFQELQLRK